MTTPSAPLADVAVPGENLRLEAVDNKSGIGPASKSDVANEIPK